jgi:hypothetical protein
VRRAVFSLAASFGLLAATLPGPWIAHAADPVSANTQSISGPSGYVYQVPSDWQQLPLSLQERVGNQSFADDGEVASADGLQHAHVETAVGFGITTDNLSDALTAFLTGAPNIFSGPGPGPAAPGASASAGNGAPPSGAASSAGGGNTPPPPTLFAQPSSVNVPNADGAMAGAASYTDSSGNARMIAARLAVKGSAAYLLVIDSTKDFYQNDPALGQIESSFQLSSGASSTAANPGLAAGGAASGTP